MTKDPKVFLIHILDNIANAQSNIKNLNFAEFLKDIKTQDAVVREIEIIGEATKNLPIEFRDKYPEISWQKIAGMRDKIVHNYFDINWEVVWNTIKKDLPDLEKKVKAILELENL